MALALRQLNPIHKMGPYSFFSTGGTLIYVANHPNMDLNDFNNGYLNLLLAKLSKEKKTVFMLGDYNVDLSKYEQHSLTNEFLDSLASSMFLPNIQPTRVTSNSKTIATISDHLPQFLFAPEIFRNSPSSKFNYFEHDWSNFNQDKFILYYFSVNWKNIINLHKMMFTTLFIVSLIHWMIKDTVIPNADIFRYSQFSTEYRRMFTWMRI